MKADYRKVTKIERQLLLYDIFHRCELVEYQEIFTLLPTSQKTIERDMKDLTDAGLIKVKFSRQEKGFVRAGELEQNLECSGKRPAHLLRLHRLGILMFELYSDDVALWEKEEGVEYYTCIDSYQELFPKMSVRTGQRDFKTLCNIGYYILYNNIDKYFRIDFPEGLKEDFGIVKRADGLYISSKRCY